MQHYEYIGKVRPDGGLPIAPSIARELVPGQKIRITIEQLSDTSRTFANKQLKEVSGNSKAARSFNQEPTEFINFLKENIVHGGYSETIVTRDFIHETD